jgi:hypothetical protein
MAVGKEINDHGVVADDPAAGQEGPPGIAEPSPSPGRWTSWPVLIALFAVAGLAWTLMTPPMGVPDEPAYAVHAVALWSGQVESSPTPTDATARAVPGGNNRWYRLPEVWYEGYLAPCFAFKAAQAASCSTFSSSSGSTDIVDVPDTLSYRVQPLWPALVGWAGRLAPGATGVYAMRLISALIGSVLLAAAVRALAAAISPRLAVVGVLAAVTPTAYFIMASVNPNGIEIAAGVSTWAHALALGRRPARSSAPPTSFLVGLAVSAGVLAFSRPLSPAFLAFILVVAGIVAVPGRLGDLWADRRARITGAIVGVELGLASAIIGVSERSAGGGDPNQPLISVSRALRHLTEAIATFGWLDTPMRILDLPWLIGLATLGIIALVCGRGRTRAGLLLVAGASASTMTLNSIPGAGGWQGRYALPLFVGVALVAIVGVSERQPGQLESSRWLVPTAGVLFVLADVVGFYRALQRFALGLPASVKANLFAATWQPPGGVIVPLVLMAGFAVAAVVLIVVTSDERQRIT